MSVAYKLQLYFIADSIFYLFWQCCATVVITKARQQPLKTILPKKVVGRFQMDLVEMPEYNGFRYILRVVDRLSCYGYVAPLRQKESEEIGWAVVKIISTSIAPEVLQSDNGREGKNKV
jgi:hypothetical protein